MASSRTLTFVERVAYQRAIEKVYWRHRIWPKESTAPKPSLDVTISAPAVESKVAAYLRDSRLVEEQRGSPITSRELQGEMERMAQHSHQPEVLADLFSALGNDPVLVAECLARPTLAERLVKPATTGTRSILRVSLESRATAAVGAYKLPPISRPSEGIDNTWTATSTGVDAPEARETSSVVWTGSEMIVWGGENTSFTPVNTGARYNPATDHWSGTSTTNAPALRGSETAVWTGTEMIVWGGDAAATSYLSTGGRYDPAANTWTSTSTVGAAVARDSHTAIWTGSEMIVWGGWGGPGCTGNCMLNSGGRYDPRTDTWTAMSTVNAPAARYYHKAFWTGTEMIVWGGTDQTNYLHTGGRYNPRTDTWTSTRIPPSTIPGRYVFAGVWTGAEMIVWGGVDEFFNSTNTGGRYNPQTDEWIATNIDGGAPSARGNHSAVWTGREMIVWGGGNSVTDFNNGKKYDPGTDTWRPITTANAPEARGSHSAVWTGNEM
ncbi:MAG: hypothetical protein M3Z32_09805, partial [Acidobacteriota bacterium]|nr:hypothetical protein [Acidobacteriota bacterium]